MPLSVSMKYLDWSYSCGCVFQVIEENKAAGKLGNWKPDADTWAWYSEARSQIFVRARRAWCLLTLKDESYFPLSEDAVARLYFRYRKRNDGEVSSFKRQINKRLDEINSKGSRL